MVRQWEWKWHLPMYRLISPLGLSGINPTNKSWSHRLIMVQPHIECCWFSSFQFSLSVVSNSLWPHELQHARPPCPSPTPEFTQTHVHRVGDAIQPSHPRSSPSPPAPIPPSIRVFSNKSTLRMRWPKYWSFRHFTNTCYMTEITLSYKVIKVFCYKCHDFGVLQLPVYPTVRIYQKVLLFKIYLQFSYPSQGYQ